MSIDNQFGKGIGVAAGFDLGAQKPLDSRIAVNTIEERDAHVTENRAYEGMLVFVDADKKTYQLINGAWVVFFDNDANIEGAAGQEAIDKAQDDRLDALETKVGKDIDGENPATGLFAEVDEAKAAAAQAAQAAANEESRAMEIEAGLQGAIDAINNAESGILAQAEAKDVAQKALIDADIDAVEKAVLDEENRAKGEEAKLAERLVALEGVEGEDGQVTGGVLNEAKEYVDDREAVIRADIKAVTDDHATRLQTAEGDIDKAESDIKDLQAAVEAIKGGDVEVDLKDVNDRIIALEAKHDGENSVEKQIEAAQNAADKAQEEVDALEIKVSEDEEDIKTLQDRMDALTNGENSIGSQLNTLKTELQAEIDEDVKVVQDELDKQKDAEQEGTLANQIKNNAEAIAALNNAENGALAQAKAYADDLDTAVRADFAAADAAEVTRVDQKIADDIAAESVLRVAEEARIEREYKAAIAQEVSDRNTAIDVEKQRAEGAEEGLSNRIKTLEDNKPIIDRAIQIIIDDLAEEVERAKGVEGELDQAIKDEAAARLAKDNELVQAIADEAAAARAAEKANKDAIDVLNGTVEVEGSVKKQIADAIDEVNGAAAGLEARVKANEDALAIVQGNDTVAGSIAKAEKDAKAYADQKVADLVGEAPELLDTLEEIAKALDDNPNIKEALETACENRIAAVKTELQGEIDDDVKAEADRAAGVEAAIRQELANEKAALQGEIDSDIAAERVVREAAEQAIQDAVDAIEERLDKEDGIEDRIEALEAANAEGGAVANAIAEAKDAADAAQDTADAAQGEVDALEGVVEGINAIVGVEAKDGAEATGLVKKVADNAAAIEQEVEDRNAAIAEALEVYSTTEEVKTILGNVVATLNLSMVNDKVVLKLGGAEGISLSEVSLDMATDEDIDAIINGLDTEEA